MGYAIEYAPYYDAPVKEGMTIAEREQWVADLIEHFHSQGITEYVIPAEVLSGTDEDMVEPIDYMFGYESLIQAYERAGIKETRQLTGEEWMFVQSAVSVLCKNAPEMAPWAAIFHPVYCNTMSTLATDNYFRCMIGPWFFDSSLDSEERQTLLAHEMFHPILGHTDPSRSVDAEVSNIAGDYQINQGLRRNKQLHWYHRGIIDPNTRHADPHNPVVGIFPEDYKNDEYKNGLPEGWTYEKYYSVVYDDRLKQRDHELNSSEDDSGQAQSGNQNQSGNNGGDTRQNGSRSDKDMQNQASGNDTQQQGQSGSNGNGNQSSAGGGSSSDDGGAQQGGSTEQGNNRGQAQASGDGTQSGRDNAQSNGSSVDNGEHGQGASNGSNDQQQGKSDSNGQDASENANQTGTTGRGGNQSGTGNGSGNGNRGSDNPWGDGEEPAVEITKTPNTGYNNGQGNNTSSCSGMSSEQKDELDKLGIERAGDYEKITAKTASINIAQKNARKRSDGGRSSYGSNFTEWFLEMLRPPKVSWKKLFRNVIGRDVEAIVNGRSDYSYRRPARRPSQFDPTVVRPGMIDYEVRIVFGVDTSGSMGSDDHVDALSEIQGALRHIRRAKSTIAMIDTDITETKDVRSIRDFTLKGGGGTEMNVFYKWVKKMPKRKAPDITVLATDGYIDWDEVYKEILNDKRTFKHIILVTEQGGMDCGKEYINKLNKMKNATVLLIESDKHDE